MTQGNSDERRSMSSNTKPQPKPLPPRDRRLPLSTVLFHQPEEVPGLRFPVKRLVSGEEVPNSDGCVAPQLFVDFEERCVVIGEYRYPLENVRHYVRAKAAK